jgi:glycosyltransferase involved in cell wall biosynthesis
MNILYFCQLYYPAIYGGGEYIFFQWTKELTKRGHKVFVITQRLVGERNFEIIKGVSVYRVGPAIEYKGVLPLGMLDNLGYIISAIKRGITLIGKNKINMVHSNTYASALAGQVCAIISGRVHIITVHDIYFLTRKDFRNKWASQASPCGFIGKIGPLIEKLVLRFPAKVFHTVSETNKENLYACGLQKVIVIYNGIDLRDFDSINATNFVPHQAIFIGRLVFYKNLNTVIKSMKSIVARIPDSRLIVVGDGPMRLPLEKLVEDLGLTKNIVFKGRISHEKKVRLLKQSSLLVLPSLVEGFGIVLLEAFVCYKPVLVSIVKPLTEIVEDGGDGYYVSPFDVSMWANKMIKLFEDPDMAKELGLHGRRKLEQKFTIQKTVDELEKLYFDITNHR